MMTTSCHGLGEPGGVDRRCGEPHTGVDHRLQYADMDEIVRDLVAKNYAQLGERLELYRLWICLLHIKGIRFIRA